MPARVLQVINQINKQIIIRKYEIRRFEKVVERHGRVAGVGVGDNGDEAVEATVRCDPAKFLNL